MTTVDRVKELCKQRQIPISRLEKDLGFSNGYIGQLKKGTFPDDRLSKIAEYFGVDTNYLIHGDKYGETKNPPSILDDGQVPEGYEQLTPDNRELVDALIAQLAKSQLKNGQDSGSSHSKLKK